MRVFLIGGTGYIGRAVATALAEHGHSPVVLSRSAASAAKVTDDRVEIIEGALSDLDLLGREAVASDAVVYLAVPGLSGATPEDLSAIESILELFRDTRKSFVLTSGLAVYLGTSAPFVDSDTDISQALPHQAWRVELEQKVLGARDSGVRSVVIRPSIVYGGGTASALLLGLMRHVAGGGTAFYIGDGSNRIPTVHVDDLALAFVRAVESAPSGASYNVASGSILGVDLARAVADGADPDGLAMDDAIAAIGPAAGVLGMDLKVSEWHLASDLGWSGHADSLVLELAQKKIRLEG